MHPAFGRIAGLAIAVAIGVSLVAAQGLASRPGHAEGWPNPLSPSVPDVSQASDTSVLAP